MGNNAVNVNQPYGADIHITNRGSSWLWAVFTFFSLATLVFIFVGHRRAASDRIFSYFTSAITLISALTYFAIASNLGFVGVPVEFVRSGNKVAGRVRQVFWARYIQWFLNIILIVLALLLTARVPTAQILFTVLAAGATIVFGLAGALTPTRYKWGFFVIAIAVFIYVVFALFHPGRRHSGALGSDIGRAFKLPSLYALVILTFYPIAWGVCEGGNVIAPDSEAIFYGILDLSLFIGFGALFTFGHRSIEPSRLGLRMRTYDEELSGGRHGHSTGEKRHVGAGTAAGVGVAAAGAHHGHHHDTLNGAHTGGVTGTHGTQGNGVAGTHNTGMTGTHNNGPTGTHAERVGHHGGTVNPVHEPPTYNSSGNGVVDSRV